MRYSIKPRERIYVKGYGFMSFAKNIVKNLSNKYSQKIIDKAKKSATDAIKTASQWAIQKTAEATGNLVGNKIADKITGKASTKDVSISKKCTKRLSTINEDQELSSCKKRYISPEERQQIIDELRLVPKN